LAPTKPVKQLCQRLIEYRESQNEARLSNLKDLLQFSLDHVQDNIKRKESNISFSINSCLNYGGTLNSLVAYNAYQILDAFVP
jgi:hypothetical protein